MKIYRKPVVELINIECAEILAASPEITFSPESADNSVEALSKKQDNTWGDLWSKQRW